MQNLNSSKRDYEHFLQTIPYFSDLDSQDLELIAREMNFRYFKAGEDLLTQGEKALSVFLIVRGIVDILVNDDRVAQRSRMDSIGEMSCLSGEEDASATVRAITDCQALEINRKSFLGVIAAIPQLQSQMFGILTGRLRKISHRFSEVLKHVSHGIVKIDFYGIISAEFSSRCTDYLGIKQLAGKNIGLLFFSDDELILNKWNSIIHSFASNDEEDLSQKINQLPTEISYHHPAGGNRVFKLYYHISIDEKGKKTGLDIGIEDVTLNRYYQTELVSFQDIVTKLEQLLVLFNPKTGIISQETFSHSQLGALNFPVWKGLKGKSIIKTILYRQEPEKMNHLTRWLKMLDDRFFVESMSTEELIKLAPIFRFESAQGKVVEMVFVLHQKKNNTYPEVMGRFKFIEEKNPSLEDNRFSTIELMVEVIAAENEYQEDLFEVLNEIKASIEIAQHQLLKSGVFAKHQESFARNIHSIKGLAQSFNLSILANASHEVEEILQEFIGSGQSPAVNERLVQSLESILAIVVVSRSLCDSEKSTDLGFYRNRKPELRLPLTLYQRLKKKLIELKEDKAILNLKRDSQLKIEGIINDVNMFDLKSLNSVFPRLKTIVNSSCKILDKKTNLIIEERVKAITGIDVEYPVSTCLIQLIKNAVFHGVENVSERRFLQKSETGQITLVVDSSDKNLIMTIKDDGKGFNKRKILDQAANSGIINAQTASRYLEENDEQAIFNILFEEGFSTTGDISMISGRGIGMGLIRTEIEKLGGTIHLESQEGAGSCISLTIPLTENQIVIENKVLNYQGIRRYVQYK